MGRGLVQSPSASDTQPRAMPWPSMSRLDWRSARRASRPSSRERRPGFEGRTGVFGPRCLSPEFGLPPAKTLRSRPGRFHQTCPISPSPVSISVSKPGRTRPGDEALAGPVGRLKQDLDDANGWHNDEEHTDYKKPEPRSRREADVGSNPNDEYGPHGEQQGKEGEGHCWLQGVVNVRPLHVGDCAQSWRRRNEPQVASRVVVGGAATLKAWTRGLVARRV